MASARCVDCAREWETDEPAEELREQPRCPGCGGGRVDVQTEAGWYIVWR